VLRAGTSRAQGARRNALLRRALPDPRFPAVKSACVKMAEALCLTPYGSPFVISEK